MMTMADKGGRGVWTPPFLADIICEQPLRDNEIKSHLKEETVSRQLFVFSFAKEHNNCDTR